MKNGIIKKIAGLSLGIAMAIGVGVAVGHRGVVNKVDATSTTFKTFTGSGGDTFTNDSCTKNGVTLAFAKGTGSDISWQSGHVRIYANNTVTISSAAENVTAVAFTVSGSYERTWEIVSGGGEFETVDETVNYKSWSGSTSSLTLKNNSSAQWRLTQVAVTTTPKSAPSNPITKIELSTEGDATSVEIGKTLSLTVTVTPSDTDEKYTISSGAEDKLTLSGESSPYTLTGIAEADSVTITATADYSDVSATKNISVIESVQTEEDKVLTSGKLNMTSSYQDAEVKARADGVDYKWHNAQYVSNTDRAIQLKKNAGYIYNDSALLGNVKTVTLMMSSGNSSSLAQGDVGVRGGTSKVTSNDSGTAGTLVGTFSYNGINVYDFSTQSFTYIRIADVKNNYALKIDTIIVELADGTTTSLSKARTAAGHILTDLNGKCGTGGSGIVTDEEWASLKTKIEASLGEDDTAKALLKNAIRIRIDDLSLAGAKIESAMWRYDYLVENYHKTPITSITNKTASNTTVQLNQSLHTSNYVIILVAISATSILALGALLLLKKKKEN